MPLIMSLLHQISIHSLRMEGDQAYTSITLFDFDFNPLPPHGGRPSPHKPITPFCNISIHSLRMEGDVAVVSFSEPSLISIHSLRMEGDDLSRCRK